MIFDFLFQLLFQTIFAAEPAHLPAAQEAGQAVAVQADAPTKIDSRTLGIEITAPYAVVLDAKTKAVLFEKNRNLQTPIASITKLVAAMVFLDNNPGWGTMVTVEPEDMRPGGQVYLLSGDTLRVQDVFSLSLISSSNEATITLARSTGLPLREFVNEMNAKVRGLGLESTYFVEPTGLEPANISTAYEIALLAEAAFAYDDIAQVSQQKFHSFRILNTGRNVFAASTDKLLDSFINDANENYRIVGAKTGYINESKYCFTTEIERGGNAILITVMGSETAEDRWQEVKGLAEWAFSSYQWPEKEK